MKEKKSKEKRNLLVRLRRRSSWRRRRPGGSRSGRSGTPSARNAAGARAVAPGDPGKLGIHIAVTIYSLNFSFV